MTSRIESLKIGIIGLGYVGLPLALALGQRFKGTVGFDIKTERVKDLSAGIDLFDSAGDYDLAQSSVQFTDKIEDLKDIDVFIVGVPTPIDKQHRPNLAPLIEASKLVGSVIKKGAIVVYESTVYPGVTEDICGKVLAQASRLKQGQDFFLGYSPERINPGDKEHTLATITKIISAENEQTLDIIEQVYSSIVDAGLFKATSIKVAEAAKVIENTQRDLNIALMNELSLIFDRMDIKSSDVLEAAGSKWNFLNFKPGLVGGHCIGVDPYYLTSKAEELGYHPEVILAGRRINDNMGHFVAQKMIKLLARQGISIKNARIGILGVTFKENVSDTRNSRVPDIVSELKQFSIEPLIHDPLVIATEFRREYGSDLNSIDEFKDLDGLIWAVGHEEYLELVPRNWSAMLKKGGVFIDVKSYCDPETFSEQAVYWSL